VETSHRTPAKRCVPFIRHNLLKIILSKNERLRLHGIFIETPIDDQLKMMRLNMTTVTELSHSYLKQAENEMLVNIMAKFSPAKSERNL
jgi:short-subunit dehydrogenase